MKPFPTSTRSVRRRDYRSVGRPVGVVVIGLGVTIGICALVSVVLDSLSAVDERRGTMALALASAITLALGSLLYVYGKRHVRETVSRREAILAVAGIWLAAGLCGALPFVFGAGMSFPDAFFESVSGLTTTGATVVTDIEGTLSRPILLWRSLIQWLGGMGIVVLFVAVFPNVGVGGKHMFRGEVPGTSAEGLKPRIAETSFTLWKLYVAFTAIEAVALALLGMDPFEAVCHAFTTMSTGGFSTRNASIAAFESPAIEFTIAAFMYLGSVNYGLYFGALRGRSLKVIITNIEFRAYVAIVAVSVLALTLGILGNHGHDLFESFRYAFFMVGTTISSTGYGTDDYMAYPSPVLSIVILLMFIGGCAGSTAGGIKIERTVLMAKRAWGQVGLSFSPNVVKVVRVGRRAVETSVLADVAAFFIVFMTSIAVCVFAITVFEGVPVPTAFGATLTCLSNMGPAPFHLEADNFAAYGAATKLLCVVAMLLGRLEFFTLLALLVPGFWRR